MGTLGGKKKPFLAGAARNLGRALNPGILSGLSLSSWFHLLWLVRFRINVRYWPRALSVSLASLMNSLLERWESWRFGSQWRKICPQPPLFIIGAPRSGTTFLHNLMCTNPEFAFPNLMECRFPLSFLTLGPVIRKVLPYLLPDTRAQDNVGFGPDLPAEEESALLSMTLSSHQLAIVFPRNRDRFVRYRTLSGYTDDDIELWVTSFKAFIRKVSWRKNRMLVLKNPANTAKISLLSKVFPGARFIYIHRHPEEVFSSVLHTSQMVGPHWRLQTRKHQAGNGGMLEYYGEMIGDYMENRNRIESGRLVEVSFDELTRDPVRMLGQIYQELDLPGFEQAEAPLRAYLETLKSYRKNRHVSLAAEEREQLYRSCPEWYAEWGYQKTVE